MRRILSAIMMFCLLFGAVASMEEDTVSHSFLLRIRNESGLDISYLRFDIYMGEDYAGLVCSCPDKGEDFYRFPFDTETPEELNDLRIECSYGISDLSPEDAILQVMMGNPAEEHPLLTMDFIPEYGKVYDLKLVSDGEEAWLLIPIESLDE